MADLSGGWADTEKLLTQDVCNVNAKLRTMKGVCSRSPPPKKNHTWLFHLLVNTPKKKNVQRVIQNFSSYCEHALTLKRGCRGAERDRMENKVCIWSDLSRGQMQLSNTIWTDGLYPFSVERQCMQKFAEQVSRRSVWITLLFTWTYFHWTLRRRSRCRGVCALFLT